MEAFIKEASECKKRVEVIIDASLYHDKLQEWLKTFDNDEKISKQYQIQECIKLIKYSTSKSQNKHQKNKLLLFKNGIRNAQHDICYIKEEIEELSFIENEKIAFTVISYFKDPIEARQININNVDTIQISYTINIPIKESIVLSVELIKEVDKNIDSHINYLKYNIKNIFCKNATYKKFIHGKSWNLCDKIIIHLYPNINLTTQYCELIHVVKNITKILCIDHVLSREHVISNLLNTLMDPIKMKTKRSYDPHKIFNKNIKFQELLQVPVPLNILDLSELITNNSEKYSVYPKYNNSDYIIYLNYGRMFLINEVDVFNISLDLNSVFKSDLKSNFICSNINDRKSINKSDIRAIMCANLVKNNNIFDLYIYDILHYQLVKSVSLFDTERSEINKALIYKPYLLRCHYINDIIEILNSFKCILSLPGKNNVDVVFKRISMCNLNNISTFDDLDTIDKTMEGIIIKNNTEGNFLSQKSMIWKYKKNITIRFLIRNTTIPGEYTLNVEHNFKGNNSVIPFKPRDYPFIYKYKSKDKIILDEEMGEFYWTGKRWKFIKNSNMVDNFETAELVWQSRKNYIDIQNLFNIKSIKQKIISTPITHLFTKYIKSKFNKIALFYDNAILENNDLYNIAKKSLNNNNGRAYLFIENYVETWTVKNIHSTFHQNIHLMNKIITCPSILNMITHCNIKKNKEKLEMKGITLPINEVEIFIIICYDTAIILNNLVSIIVMIKKIIKQYGKVIFIGCQDIFDANNTALFQSKKMELELKTREFVSFIKI